MCDHRNLKWLSREDGNSGETWRDNYECLDCGADVSEEGSVWDEDNRDYTDDDFPENDDDYWDDNLKHVDGVSGGRK